MVGAVADRQAFGDGDAEALADGAEDFGQRRVLRDRFAKVHFLGISRDPAAAGAMSSRQPLKLPSRMGGTCPFNSRPGELGDHPIEPIPRFADVFEEQDAVAQGRQVGRPAHCRQERQVSAHNWPFDGVARRRGEERQRSILPRQWRPVPAGQFERRGYFGTPWEESRSMRASSRARSANPSGDAQTRAMR